MFLILIGIQVESWELKHNISIFKMHELTQKKI